MMNKRLAKDVQFVFDHADFSDRVKTVIIDDHPDGSVTIQIELTPPTDRIVTDALNDLPSRQGR